MCSRKQVAEGHAEATDAGIGGGGVTQVTPKFRTRNKTENGTRKRNRNTTQDRHADAGIGRGGVTQVTHRFRIRKKRNRRLNGEVPRGEKVLYSGTEPESCITEYTLAYEDNIAMRTSPSIRPPKDP